VEIHYGSRDNQFWLIVSEVYGVDLCPPNMTRQLLKELRIQFLRDNGIGFQDILQEWWRRAHDANDTNLEPLTFSDLGQILRQRPAIDTLIITGGQAEIWTGQQMEKSGLIHVGHFWRDVRGKKMPRERRFRIELDGKQREINIYTLPSPSPSADRRYRLPHKIEMYRSILLLRSLKKSAQPH
jgi:G:T/U-mismatch repair DNA glycosylase